MSGKPQTFALIGAAGYVAPRHMKAISGNQGVLVAALDPNDSVGIIDSHFPDARFFTEFERFDRHLDKLRRKGEGVDYVSICSPNYLHDAHARFALRSGADAICEKPLVLNPWNIDGLEEMEQTTGRRVHTILQLRLHPAIIALKEKIDREPNKIHDLNLTYITSRGGWYYVSWKGNEEKSGGIASNIGIHFFDMLIFLFGGIEKNVVHLHQKERAAGYIEFQRAKVKWFLSIDRNDLPEQVRGKQPTYRAVLLDGEEIEFSGGFTDLHTLSYEQIMAGNGFSLQEARPSIETVATIRKMTPDPTDGEIHAFTRNYL